MLILEDVIKIVASATVGYLIGLERYIKQKPCGKRTVAFISLGATLTVLMTFKLSKFGMEFDAIRAIAYYLVALGFIGGGIIRTTSTKIENITTGALILPVALVGFLIGFGEYPLALISTVAIFTLLRLKSVQVLFNFKNKKRRKKNVSKRQDRTHITKSKS